MSTALAELIQVIQSCLTDDLRRKPYKGNPNPVAGHCYVASEAIWHLLGGSDSEWRPMFVRHEGHPHWFLQRRDMDSLRIIDPTAGQFKEDPPWLDMSKCRRQAFLTKKPSKRAQILMARYWAKCR